jgi:hypothetical protein
MDFVSHSHIDWVEDSRLHNESERIREISNTHIALRYAPKPAGVALA